MIHAYFLSYLFECNENVIRLNDLPLEYLLPNRRDMHAQCMQSPFWDEIPPAQ